MIDTDEENCAGGSNSQACGSEIECYSNGSPVRQEIFHKSSKEFYKAVAAQWGITCKMSDHCRCLECQVKPEIFFSKNILDYNRNVLFNSWHTKLKKICVDSIPTRLPTQFRVGGSFHVLVLSSDRKSAQFS